MTCLAGWALPIAHHASILRIGGRFSCVTNGPGLIPGRSSFEWRRGRAAWRIATPGAVPKHSAIGITEDYFKNTAAANTDIDPNAGLLPPEMKGHWG